MNALQAEYPWTKAPLIACAPMRLIALSSLAVEVSAAGGIGFIGAGSDVSTLAEELNKVRQQLTEKLRSRHPPDVLPVGVGFLLWAGDQLLADALPIIEEHTPAVVWLFAPNESEQLTKWCEGVRRVTRGRTKIWIQVGTVADAVQAAIDCQPEVIVVQGNDAGGHGLQDCAGLVALLPEVDDSLSTVCSKQDIRKPHLVAAGGIIEGRGAAAALALGAAGITMGTRYLACPEANIADGYRNAVLTASDGGVTTRRGKLYDSLRGTTSWPSNYGGRGVLNESHHDAANGMSFEENKRLYDEAMTRGDEGWGHKARLTTYAGTGVGLVTSIKSAADITAEVRNDALSVLHRLGR